MAHGSSCALENGDGSLNGGILNLHWVILVWQTGQESGSLIQITFLSQCSKQKTSSCVTEVEEDDGWILCFLLTRGIIFTKIMLKCSIDGQCVQ